MHFGRVEVFVTPCHGANRFSRYEITHEVCARSARPWSRPAGKLVEPEIMLLIESKTLYRMTLDGVDRETGNTGHSPVLD